MLKRKILKQKDALNMVANELTTATPPTQTTSTSPKQQEQHEKVGQSSQISQEEIAKITQGIGALVNIIKEKTTATAAVEEEKMAKVDSKDGKMQLPTTTEEIEAAKKSKEANQREANILSDLLEAANKLGKAVNQQNPQQQKPGNNVSDAEGTTSNKSFSSQDDIAKITAGINSLVESFKKQTQDKQTNDGKGADHPAQTEQSEQSAKSGGDFLNNLMSIANDLSKVVAERNTSTAQNATSNDQHLGTIRGKATDIFQKPKENSPSKEKEEKQSKDEPVIDDVEEEKTTMFLFEQ
ncbi:hypothetical protein DICVIV_08126 [Dictyocaulus viviparus]|uniref:Uncharacterized protein n=1 Tax=Dictyocaulus viviparus TaxID=29172 RepID=A0A0D8XMI1_DICVI|nr:hypothetical protein DICVIV_08126 [Dictyocaulus viviparus]